ncbi:MAG: universal stress protein [Leptolyngbya sp. PLA3]|nr:MAG: universal stress protein [Cyanobacteria bacterium CYA]MCE7969489.1 universal stress protein [Leptolyngbya sp. PL-A3]
MKILLAIDGSTFSHAAIREVGLRPWPPATEARVVTVDARLDESTLAMGRRGGLGSSAYDELVRCQRAEANDNLDKAAASLRQIAPQLAVSTALLEGSPKEEIVNEARCWEADLIVVGSHGRGVIKSLFLGSVSLAVVLSAPCSVLVVRGGSTGAGTPGGGGPAGT